MRYLVLTAIIILSFISDSFAGNKVEKITVSGNQRIEVSTIMSYINFVDGDEYSEELANSSVKKLFETGLFTDVSVSLNGGELIIKVKESPIINKVAFEGNKRINDDDLAAETSLKSRSVYTRGQVMADVKRINDLYRKKGRFSVIIEPKVISLDNNRIDLVYEVDEGKKAAIKKIYFVGNENVSTGKLQSIIATKEYRWYKFFSSSDSYDPDRVAFDSELMRKYYVARGYADFRVTSSIAEINDDKDSFVLTYSIEEGQKYKFGDITIESKLPDVKPAELNGYLKTVKGEIFNMDLVDKTIESMTSYLNDSGYAFIDVNPNYKQDKANLIMGVEYQIAEGPKVYIDKINISGNVRTLDKVIRREFRVAEGDPYNASKLRRSQERIKKLDYFEKVEFDTERSDSPDRANINLKVDEKSTGELNFGVGYSTTEGMLGEVSVRERNLLGKGQDLRVRYQDTTRGSTIDLGFTEPYFMDRDLAAGFDIFNITRDNRAESSYDSDTTGGNLRAAYSLTEHLRHSVHYSYKNVNITNIQSDASTYIKEQKGKNVTSLVGHTFTYDTTDDINDPTKGYYVSLSQDVAGLGGDSKFIRNELRGSYYKPVYKEDVVLNLSQKFGNVFGIAGETIKISDRFFVGSSVIRGFKNAGIGPRDVSTMDALGGKTYYAASAEVTFPLGLPEELGFKGAVFVDTATLYDIDTKGDNIRDINSMRASSGAGIAWSSPMGPIRLDVARAFVKESFDRTETIRFNFGTRF